MPCSDLELVGGGRVVVSGVVFKILSQTMRLLGSVPRRIRNLDHRPSICHNGNDATSRRTTERDQPAGYDILVFRGTKMSEHPIYLLGVVSYGALSLYAFYGFVMLMRRKGISAWQTLTRWGLPVLGTGLALYACDAYRSWQSSLIGVQSAVHFSSQHQIGATLIGTALLYWLVTMLYFERRRDDKPASGA